MREECRNREIAEGKNHWGQAWKLATTHDIMLIDVLITKKWQVQWILENAGV